MAPWAAANATLLELRGPATIDDYGDPTGLGALKWAGEHEECALIRERETVVSGGENTPVERDVLIVRLPPPAVALAVTGDSGTGDVILVEDRRLPTPVWSRFRLINSTHRGVGAAVNARFELDGETPADDPAGSGAGSGSGSGSGD